MAYGLLMGNQSVENYHALLDHVIPNQFEQSLVAKFFDGQVSHCASVVASVIASWSHYMQYKNYISRNLPQDFVDEMKGYEEAGNQIGHPELQTLIARGLAMASILVDNQVRDGLDRWTTDLVAGP